MGTNKNRLTVTSRNQQIETALPKYFAKKSFELVGETWTTTQVVTTLEKEDTLIAAAAKAHADWQAAASAARAQTVANNALRQQLDNAVKSSLDGNSSALAEFGIVVKARKQPSPQVRIVAAAKAAATRLARGTMSRKQRLAIHAVVPTTPVAASGPAAPVTSGAASPAPNGTTGK
jgi:hypothetical protein